MLTRGRKEDGHSGGQEQSEEFQEAFHSKLEALEGSWGSFEELAREVANGAADSVGSPEMWRHHQAELDERLKEVGALILEARLNGCDVQVKPPVQDEPSLEIVGEASDTADDGDPKERAESDEKGQDRSDPVQVTSDLVEQLQAGMQSGLDEDCSDEQVAEYAEEAAALETLRDELEQVPEGINEPRDVSAELALLEAFLGEYRERLTKVDQEACKLLLHQLVARYRRLKSLPDEHKYGCNSRSRLKDFRTRVHLFLEEHRPGYIRGLPSRDEPLKGSWTADVRHWMESFDEYLVDTLGEVPVDRDGADFNEDRALTRIRKALSGADLDAGKVQRLVLDSLERGLDPGDKRLVNLLAPHEGIVETRKLRSVYRAIQRAKDNGDGDSEQDGEFESVSEALSAAETDFEILNVFKTARKSAENSDFEQPEEIYRAFEAIAEIGGEYLNTKARGEALGKSLRMLFEKRGFKQSHGETEITANRYGHQRSFQGRTITRHLTIGQGNPRCVQIYFQPNEERGQVDVGYCGPHLDTHTTN